MQYAAQPTQQLGHTNRRKSLKSFEAFGLTFANIYSAIEISGGTHSPLFFHHTAEEIYMNSRTFLWPHELEQVLELSGARLSVVRENLEVALK